MYGTEVGRHSSAKQGYNIRNSTNDKIPTHTWPDSAKASNLRIDFSRTAFKYDRSSRTAWGDRASLNGFLAIACTLGCSLKLTSAFSPDRIIRTA